MSGFHPVSVFTCRTVRKGGGSRGKFSRSTHAVPVSFGIARESMLPYVHVTMYPFPLIYPFSFLSAPKTLAISLPTLGLSVTIAIIFFFLLMFRTVRNGTERELYLLFPGQTAASSF